MVDDSAAYPLSAAQRQLWLLQRLQPDSGAYNISFALRVMGPLRIDALRGALGAVLNRHDVLRTRYPDRDGEPVQLVSTRDGHELSVVDLTRLPPADRAAALDRLLDEDLHRPFDLAAGPVFRNALVRLAAEEHVLLLGVHHIAFDGASTGLFFDELEECYAGRAADLPPVRTQYTDYAHWQHTHSFDSDLRFWRHHLADAPTLALPTDHPAPPVRTERGAGFRFELGTDLSERVATLAEARKTTQFVVLLAAFELMLARYTGARDIVVGTSVSTRDRAELDGTIGFFVNTLALRVRLPAETTARELLDQVDAVVFECLDHAAVPFDEVVRAVAPSRAGNRTPLAQVCFSALDERHLGSPKLPGLRVERIDVGRTTTKFDLDVDAFLTPTGVHCAIEYSTELFDEGTVRRMAEHWRQVLRAVVTDPDVAVSAIDPLTPAEREQVLHTWNGTDAGVGDDRRMHELFEAQAARTPDLLAVVSGTEELTYAEVEGRANQLAHAMLARGVGTESVVGICLPRSADLVVTLLAVLKAGGAFVPLDPELPAERLAFMAADANMTLLLTSSDVDGAVPAGGPPRLLLDRHRPEWSVLPVEPPGVAGGLDNLACLIYTSGSTGAPKCAMLSHGNFTNYFHAFEDEYDLTGTVRVLLQMAAFSFDIFVADTMRALFIGATLVLCPREVLLSPPDLHALMVRTGVNSAEFVPAVLRTLLDHLEETGESLSFMDLLAAGGDSWYASDYVRAQRLCAPNAVLVDTYGTTETGIDNVTFTGDLPRLSGDVVPIGRPLNNTQLYVLDEAMRPVPVGVTGELYLGGRGVGRGYAGRPGLTAERYVPDPFGRRPGARLYRTGDLGRHQPDGTVEIIGRADSQVKIRGYRIELGEIESVLREHPAVAHAAVVVRERDRDRALAAFVTSAPGATAEVSGLREHLRARLPRYMVPAAISVLDRIPLNSNGKLDRSALPPVVWDAAEADRDHVPPATPAEEVIAGIVADVLGIDRVGVTEDFFELGGHSLLAMRLVSRIRTALRVELPLLRVFDSPTVRELAECLRRLERDGSATGQVVAVDRPADGLPLSFAQQRLWFIEQMDPGTTAYHLPTVLRLDGRLDVDTLRAACATVVARHEALRTVIRARAGVPRQVVLPPYEPDIRVEDVSHVPATLREPAAARLVETERSRLFDLAAGPLLRVAVIRLSADEHLLVLTMHHIVTDGWSAVIFLRELSECYAAGAGATPATLPELPVQYADYAVWQRRVLDEKAVAGHLDHWREHLRGAPELVDLPLDHPRRSTPGYHGQCVERALDQAEVAAVERFGRQEGATLFMTLLTAFQVLLARYCDQDDIVVGTATANRTQPAVENLVGFFVNTLPLRLNLSDAPTFRTALERVRASALAAYAHQDLPFERLVEELRPRRDPSYLPLVQVLCTVQSNDPEVLRLPGVAVRPVPLSITSSKFDLSMEATRTDTGLAYALWYRTELFESATIERLAQDWRTLLLAAVAAPDTPVGALPAPRHAESPPRARRAASDLTEDALVSEPVAPTTAVHRVLAAVWREVLRKPVTDVTADFFGLGGHSLLAVQVTARVAELLGVRITVRTMFEHSTLDKLAVLLEPLVPADRVAEVATVLERLDGLDDDEVGAVLAGGERG